MSVTRPEQPVGPLTYEEEAPFDLTHTLSKLWRRKWLVVAAVVLCAGAAAAYSMSRPKSYVARAQVLLESDTVSEFAGRSPFGSIRGTDTQTRAQEIDTAIEVLRSRVVRDAVSDRLGQQAPPISAKRVRETNFIELRAGADHAAMAAEVVNDYAAVFVDFRKQEQRQQIKALQAGAKTKLEGVRKDIEALNATIAARQNDAKVQAEAQAEAERAAAITGSRYIPPVANLSVVIQNAIDDLMRQRDLLLGYQSTLRQKLDDLVQEDVQVTGGSRVVIASEVPLSPASPKPVGNVVLGAVFGLLLGVGAVASREFMDHSVHSADDVRAMAPGAPVLTSIPRMKRSWRRRGLLVVASQPDSTIAESFRRARTGLTFLPYEGPLHSLLVTSPGIGEGRSTVAANVALAFAQARQRVAVVDADLRNPSLHLIFELFNSVGLSSVLTGGVALEDAIQPAKHSQYLSVLTAGPAVDVPSDLFTGEEFSKTLTLLGDQADVVIVDGPPMLTGSDGSLIAAQVNETAIVVRVGHTTARDLVGAIHAVKSARGAVCGVILNAVREKSKVVGNDRRPKRRQRPKSVGRHPALTSLSSPPAGETPALVPTPTRSSRGLPAPAPAEETVASVSAEPAAETRRPATIPALRIKSQAAWREDLIARPRRLARLRVRVRYLAVAGVVAAVLVASAWMLTSRHVERAGRDVVTASTAPPPTTVPPPVTPPSTAITSAPATTVASTTSAPSTAPPPPPPEPVVAEPPAPPPTSPPTTTRAARVVTAPAPPPPTAPPVTTTSPPPPPTNPNFP